MVEQSRKRESEKRGKGKVRPGQKRPKRNGGRSSGKIEVGPFGNTLKLSKDTPSKGYRMHKISLKNNDTNSIYFEVHLLRLPIVQQLHLA